MLSKPYLLIKDVRVLCDCGQKQAKEIVTEYENWIIDQGYSLPRFISTADFVKWRNIDESRIIKFAKLGL